MFVYIFVYTILGYHRPILYATILFSSYSDLRSRAQLEVADPDFTSKLLLNSQLISLFPFPVLSSSNIGIVFLLNSAFWNKFAFERFNLLVLMADFPASSSYLGSLPSFEKMHFQHILMDIGRRWHRSRFQKWRHLAV